VAVAPAPRPPSQPAAPGKTAPAPRKAEPAKSQLYVHYGQGGAKPGWDRIGPVRRRASVKLDASGDGSVSFDVFTANSRWVIESVVCSASGATPALYPQAVLYVGGQQSGVSEGASWIGNQETFTGIIEMTGADTLTVAFSGGTSGTMMTVIIEGTNFLWR